MAFCKLLTVLVLIHNTGGLLGAEVESSIVGGQDASKVDWPFMVHLNITTKDGKTKWRCGGTILNDEWVLTAASCWDPVVTKYEPYLQRSMAWVGTYNLQDGAVKYMGIVYVIPHPKYRALERVFLNDIALVKLTKKIKFTNGVDTVRLPSVDDAVSSSSECWIIGWGNVGTNVKLRDPETLQQLKVPIIPHHQCKKQYPDLTADMLCAGDKAGGKGPCDGDNGGPLVCRTASGLMQMGIISSVTRDGCALADRPGIFTQVSKHLRFINDYIHQGEEASAEV